MLDSWPMNVPIMAVSGGCHAAPNIDHFVSCDKPICYPEWVTTSKRFHKHVVHNAKSFRWWQTCPMVVGWEYAWKRREPTWGHGPIVQGLDDRNHSLLMAVQVAHRLRYERLVFIGCDLNDSDHEDVSDLMHEWHKSAVDSGYVWENASAMSRLQEWMPTGDLYRTACKELA